MAEINGNILIGIAALFERQLDIQTNGQALAARISAAIGCFHQAGAAAGDHGKAFIRQTFGNLHGQIIIRMAFADACRAENAHRRFDHRQALETFDKLAHDLKNLPGFFLQAIRILEANQFGRITFITHGIPGNVTNRLRKGAH